MIRKYHNHKPQTTPWHHKEEPLNHHETPGRQIKPEQKKIQQVNPCGPDNLPNSRDCQNSTYLYPPAGHVITGNLNVIPDARIRNIVCKDPKYRFLSNIDFRKCRREIAASFN